MIFYEDFGAVGDGVTNDYCAFKKAHAAANETGEKLVAKEGGRYYIKLTEGEPIVIKTDVSWLGAEIGCVRGALENVDVALAAVQNHALFQHSHTVKFLASATSHASLKLDLDVKANVDGVEAAVELHGIDMDRRPADRGALDADATGALQNLVAEIGQKYPHVLKAVTVAAGIQNAVGLDADHFSPAAGRRLAGELIFCHGNILLD